MPTHPPPGPGLGRAPARITGLYVAFALVWIGLGGPLRAWLSDTNAGGVLVPDGLGAALVAVTAVPLFWLVRREVGAARRTEGLLRAVVAGTPDAVSVQDRDGRYVLVNEAAARLVGRPAGEVLGRDDRELFDPVSGERLAAGHRAVVAGGAVVTTEEVLATAGGRRIFHATKAPVRDAGGRVIGLVRVARDVTDVRQAADRARRDATFHAGVIRTAGDGVCACHAVPEFPFVRMTLWNARMAELTGYTLEEINRLGWYQSMYPDPVVQERAKARMGAMRDGVNLQGEEWEITRKDGERRVVAISTSCVEHTPGETTVVAFVRDVTDRRRADDELRASEQRFRVFVDHAADAYFLYEAGGVIRDVNRQACASLGCPREELIGRSPHEFDPGLTPAALAELFAKSHDGEAVVFDSRHRRKDGSTFPVEVRLRQFVVGGHRLALAIAHDLTARNRTLDALRASEQRFRELGDAIPQIVWTAGPDGGLTFLNARAAEYSGVPAADLTGWSWGAVIHPDDLPDTVARWTQILASGVPADIEFRIRRADGEYRWHVTRQTPARDATGVMTGWYGTCTDIEDRRRAEDTLRRTVSLLRATLDATADGILVVDLDGRIVDLNRKFVTLWNLPPELAAVGRKEDLVAAFRDPGATSAVFGQLADPEGFAARVAEIYRTPDRPSDDVVSFRDGTILERYSHPQRVDGVPVGRVWSFRDVTDRRRAEAALRASEERLRLALTAGRMGTFDWDLATNALVWSDTHYALFGYPPGDRFPVEYRHFIDRIHPDDRPAVERAIRAAMTAGTVYRNEARVLHPDGTVRWVMGSGEFQLDGGRPVRMLGAIVDITARKGAEAALARRQEVLERIAGGAALAVVLAEIVDLIESEIDESICSVLLLDDDRRLRIGAAQHLPPAYNAAIDGVAAGPAVGSCGTAAHFGRAVVVADIAADPLWADYRAAALPHGLRACWSVPILAAESPGSGPVLGTFAVYRRRACEPTPDELGVLHATAHLAGIAIERERAVRALRASEERFRALVEYGYEGINVLTPAGWSVYSSPNNASLVAIPPGEVDDDALGFVHPDDRARARDTLADVAASPGRQADVTIRLLRKDGTAFWAEAHARNLGDHPAVRGVVVNWRDVSDRVAAEARLRESEERYRLLVDTLPTSVHVVSGGRVTFCNPACVALFAAASEADLLGRTPYELLHPDSHQPVAERIATLAEGLQRPPVVVVKIVRVDGQVRTVHAVATPIPNGRHPDSHLVCLNDITQQERATALLRTVLGSVTDAIITLDERGVVRSVNPAATRQFGYAEGELVGLALDALLPETPLAGGGPPAARLLRTGVPPVPGVGREVDGRRRDGTRFPAELTVTEFTLEGERHFTGVLRDTTERRRLEEQLRQSQKMEAVGRLAGGVAHDFNNLLTVITGHCELLQAAPLPAGRWRESIAAIRDAGERAARLTQQLLAFSRKAVLEPRVLDLNELVAGSARLLRRLIGEDILLTVVTPPTPVRVKADPGQLEQVVMNLVVNARDAMPTGGRLTLETAVVAPPGGDAAGFARLTVSDTGHGMTDEVREKVFEPFFTTKGVGKGTGLGLAVVHGVVAQSGGQIAVESAVGVGTTFRLLLPLVAGEAAGAAAAGRPAATRGAETVLLVEDEDAVRMIARIALEGEGYAVLEADSGAAALRLAEAHHGDIHLLVSDVVMPEMGGRQLLEAVRRLRPGVRVLFMSGYTDDAVLLHGVVEATDAFLHKPFTPLALARKVREVIDAPAR